jgi:FdhD protein
LIVVLQKTMEISDSIFNRNFYINSSCGVCSKSSIESVHTIRRNSIKNDFSAISIDLIHSIPSISSDRQDVFKYTGGLHASVLLDKEGKVILMREDIGRHNALDKLVGALISAKIDPSDKILFVSGRAGFELVQKCIVVGIPMMIAVGAPSSLAVNLAKEYNVTLIGFANGEKFNVYSGSDRLAF